MTLQYFETSAISITICYFWLTEIVMLNITRVTTALLQKCLVIVFAVAFFSQFSCVSSQDITDDDTQGDDDEESMKSVVVLLFMFFGLSLGIMVTQILSIVGEAIPYTCVVFLLGVLFAVASNSGGEKCILTLYSGS